MSRSSPREGKEAPPHRSRSRAYAENKSGEGQVSTASLAQGNLFRMDFTDVGIRHTILNSLQLHHFIDFSPSAAAIAKEVRLCVIAIVAGWITTRVVSSLCELPRRSTSCEHCDSSRPKGSITE